MNERERELANGQMADAEPGQAPAPASASKER